MQQIATWAIGDTMIEWSSDCNNDGIVDYGQCRDGSLPDYNGNNIPDCCEQGTPCVVGSYPVQWRVSEGGNGRWYLLSSSALGWNGARQIALAANGDLCSVETSAELQWLRTWLPLDGDYLVGGWQSNSATSTSAGWSWLTGHEIDVLPTDFDDNPAWRSHRASKTINRTILHLGWGLTKLGDVNDGPFPPCADVGRRISLFEWSADCNNDGLVDKGQILRGQLTDSDNDGIPNVCECVCDVFRDFNVNGIDLGILLGQWGPANQFTVTDFNGDGSVDGSDLGQLLAAWGPCPS
jgi:hypothetical protein